MYKLGVDTGGTFTDIGLIDERTGQIAVTKVSSTPDNPALAVLEGIKKLLNKPVSPARISISLFTVLLWQPMPFWN